MAFTTSCFRCGRIDQSTMFIQEEEDRFRCRDWCKIRDKRWRPKEVAPFDFSDFKLEFKPKRLSV